MDELDRASAYEMRERNAALVNAAERAQRERRRASELRRGGRSRDCADCGDPIPRRRLRAVPHADRCVECQDASDRKRARGVA